MIIEKFTKFNLDDLDIDVSKTIFWVGAGISVDSGLPLGKALTNKYLEKALGAECSDYIKHLWQKINKKFSFLFGLEFPLIRLEFIIGCFEDVDYEFGNVRLLEGFRHFLSANPCENHRLLNLLARNCNTIIVTPNFDCGILLDQNDSFKLKYDTPHFDINGSDIYYYHGTANDIDSLGATIKKIKRGFSPEFSRYLTDKFLEGYNLVCIGFSCSDFFDVTPFFDNLDVDIFSGKAVYLQHNNELNKATRVRVNQMFKAFRSKIYFTGSDSKAFLRYLARPIDIPDKPDEQNKPNNYDWRKGFDSISIPKARNKYYLIRLVSQLGLKFENRCLVGNFKSYHNVEELLMDTIDEYLELGVTRHLVEKFPDDLSKSVLSGIREFCTFIGLDNKDISSIKKGIDCYYPIRKAGIPVREKTKDFKLLINDILYCSNDSDMIISQNVQSLNRYIRDTIHDKTISANERIKKLQILLECTEKMLSVHFSRYMYISYYLSLSKSKWRLNQILYNRFPTRDEVKRLLNIALEISSLNDAIKLLICKAELHKMSFYSNKSPIQAIKAIYWYFISFYLGKYVLIMNGKSFNKKILLKDKKRTAFNSFRP